MKVAYNEVVELRRASGDRHELANALYNYAFSFSIPTVTENKPDFVDPTGEGEATLKQALALYRELDDIAGQANVLWGVGNIHYFGGQARESAAEFQAALDLHRRVGNQTMEAWSLHMLATARLQLGEFDSSAAALAPSSSSSLLDLPLNRAANRLGWVLVRAASPLSRFSISARASS